MRRPFSCLTLCVLTALPFTAAQAQTPSTVGPYSPTCQENPQVPLRGGVVLSCEALLREQSLTPHIYKACVTNIYETADNLLRAIDKHDLGGAIAQDIKLSAAVKSLSTSLPGYIASCTAKGFVGALMAELPGVASSLKNTHDRAEALGKVIASNDDAAIARYALELKSTLQSQAKDANVVRNFIENEQWKSLDLKTRESMTRSNNLLAASAKGPTCGVAQADIALRNATDLAIQNVLAFQIQAAEDREKRRCAIESHNSNKTVSPQEQSARLSYIRTLEAFIAAAPENIRQAEALVAETGRQCVAVRQAHARCQEQQQTVAEVRAGLCMSNFEGIWLATQRTGTGSHQQQYVVLRDGQAYERISKGPARATLDGRKFTLTQVAGPSRTEYVIDLDEGCTRGTGTRHATGGLGQRDFAKTEWRRIADAPGQTRVAGPDTPPLATEGPLTSPPAGIPQGKVSTAPPLPAQPSGAASGAPVSLPPSIPAQGVQVAAAPPAGASAPAGRIPIFAGLWSLRPGVNYEFTQTAEGFGWFLPANQERGTGTVSGNSVRLSWTGPAGSGSATGTITNVDAQGVATRFQMTDGAVFTRVGPPPASAQAQPQPQAPPQPQPATSAAAPACDASGRWQASTEGVGIAGWELKPAGPGQYSAQERGLGNASGTATVSGTRLRIDWNAGGWTGNYQWDLGAACTGGSGLLTFTAGGSGTRTSRIAREASVPPQAQPQPQPQSQATAGNACGFTLGGGILARWQQLGGERGFLGCPMMNEADALRSPQGSTGKWARFKGGAITWMFTGPRVNMGYVVYGAIWQTYDSMGGSGSWLGFPTSDEYDAPGGRRSDFEGGYIFWDRASGQTRAERAGTPVAGTPPPKPQPAAANACGHTLGGGIFAKWQQLGGERGFFGCPTMSEARAGDSPQGSTGVWANFQGGLITWMYTGPRPNVGYEVHGAIVEVYRQLGGSVSWLGFPVSDEYDAPGGRRSDFEGGYIFWDRATGQTRAERHAAPQPVVTEGHVPAPPGGRNYPKPQMGGASVDHCATWGQNCGQGGADQFCRLQGHQRAASFHTFAAGRTYVIGSKQICEGGHCMGFLQITCAGTR